MKNKGIWIIVGIATAFVLLIAANLDNNWLEDKQAKYKNDNLPADKKNQSLTQKSYRQRH